MKNNQDGWRFIPHKPWHFMESHDERMTCIRQVIRQQRLTRRITRRALVMRVRRPAVTFTIPDDSFYGAGALDVAMEEEEYDEKKSDA